MTRVAAVILYVGGAEVFIDNSGLAHGVSPWLEMTADGNPDAVRYACLSVIQSQRKVGTKGLQTIEQPLLSMPRADMGQDENSIIEMISDMASGDVPIGDGHLIAEPDGPRLHFFFDTLTSTRSGKTRCISPGRRS